MDPEYGRQYRELYQRHWWWRVREDIIVRALRERLSPVTHGQGYVLDVGCGDGLFFEKLAELGGGEVEGIEPDGALLNDGSPNRGRITVAPFDARYNPGHRYRLIVALDVLEHMDDPAAALRHARTLLEDDGLLVATVPAFRLLWTTHDTINHHRTRYTRRTLSALATDAGLRIIQLEYFFHWLFPAKLAQRALESVVRPSPAPPRVPSAPINATLRAVSRIERTLLRPLHLPFGSSLLLIAKRT